MLHQDPLTHWRLLDTCRQQALHREKNWNEPQFCFNLSASKGPALCFSLVTDLEISDLLLNIHVQYHRLRQSFTVESLSSNFHDGRMWFNHLLNLVPLTVPGSLTFVTSIVQCVGSWGD